MGVAPEVSPRSVSQRGVRRATQRQDGWTPSGPAAVHREGRHFQLFPGRSPVGHALGGGGLRMRLGKGMGMGGWDGAGGGGGGRGGEEGAGWDWRRTPARPAPRSVQRRGGARIVCLRSGASCLAPPPPHPRFLWVRSRPFRAGSACHVRRASPSRQPGPLPAAAAAAGPPAHWPAGLPGFSPGEWLSF